VSRGGGKVPEEVGGYDDGLLDTMSAGCGWYMSDVLLDDSVLLRYVQYSATLRHVAPSTATKSGTHSRAVRSLFRNTAFGTNYSVCYTPMSYNRVLQGLTPIAHTSKYIHRKQFLR
jgi:hypothetical protein